MKLFTIMLAGLLSVTGIIDDIATINRLKKEAEAAYKAKEYKTAIKNYKLLMDSMQVQDDHIRMNLAHSYLMSSDTVAAQQHYSQLTNSDDKQLKSVAYQQLGIINSGKQQLKEALSLFKESLKSNPTNNDSRYNYELVKKLLEQQQQQQEQQQDNKDQNKDEQQKDQEQQQKDQQKQDKQEGEQNEQGEDEQQSEEQGQEGEQKPEDPKEQNAQEGEEQNEGEKQEEEQPVNPSANKLKEMNISEEKAKMILDAMRNSEMQYIQQNRRKSTQPRDRSKPDW